MNKLSTKFKTGQKIVRIVDGRAVDAGYEYRVIESDAFNNDGEMQLVADGGFIQELLTPDNEKEFALKFDDLQR